ncbi:Beauvericin nonribosomal cyclodepsipeptide synthetase BEA1 [Dirofilaria immitis]
MLIGTYESQDCESFQCLEDGMRAQHPTDNAEQRNSAAQSKEQKLTFLPAKLQDSLMIVNSHMPLQPAGNAEQSNLRMATKSEEIKTVQ